MAGRAWPASPTPRQCVRVFLRARRQLPRPHLYAADNGCWRTANFPGRAANFPDRICMPRTTFAGVQPTSQATFYMLYHHLSIYIPFCRKNSKFAVLSKNIQSFVEKIKVLSKNHFPYFECLFSFEIKSK